MEEALRLQEESFKRREKEIVESFQNKLKFFEEKLEQTEEKLEKTEEKLEIIEENNFKVVNFLINGMPELLFIKNGSEHTGYKSSHVAVNRMCINITFSSIKYLQKYIDSKKIIFEFSSLMKNLKTKDYIFNYNTEVDLQIAVSQFLTDLINITIFNNNLEVLSGVSIAANSESTEDQSYNLTKHENFAEQYNPKTPENYDEKYDEILYQTGMEFNRNITKKSKTKNLTPVKNNSILKGQNSKIITPIPKSSVVIPKIHNSDASDFWIIRSNDFRPIIAIEVKSPDENGDILNNLKVNGQMFDYLMSLKSFYFNGVTYGILTTFKHWRFCWLKNTNDSAESNQVLKDINLEDVPLKPRELYCSKIFAHNEKNLVKFILSIIVKAYYADYNPINLFDSNRAYIRINPDGWLWKKYHQKIIDTWNDKVTLIPPPKHTTNFTILKYFHSGKYSKVRLVISDSGHLAVIKQFQENDVDQAEQELKCWKEINEIDDVYIINSDTKVKKSLVMPLVFHATEKFEDGVKSIFFNFDLKYWSYQEFKLGGDLPKKLEEINEQLKNNKFNVYDVAIQAIKNAAIKGYIHTDLEFRHIGLYPIFENNIIIKMVPVLIDFEIIEESEDSNFSENQMVERLDYISQDCEFI